MDKLSQRIEQCKKDITVLQAVLSDLEKQKEQEKQNWIFASSNDSGRAILNLSLLTALTKKHLIDAINENKSWISFTKEGFFGMASEGNVFNYYPNTKSVF